VLTAEKQQRRIYQPVRNLNMKNLRTSASVISAMWFCTLLSAGCASVAVSSEAIESNTAFALGIDKGDFTVSDRVDDGVKSSYTVKTKTGKRYACYVTGTISVTGRTVSDAICNSSGALSSNAGAMQCNALLRAAGKCK
jgi:hypothetical protein